MSLQFYFGPSGAGKSRMLYEEITRRALQNPKQNFLVIVPDQFTMQTQKDLVLLSDRGGILNIDVLSFGRLGHRILEEVGGREIPVLDDTGKSLVLQKVAAGLKEELPTLGQMFIGARGGSLGETSCLALLIGFAYLLWRRVISWHTPAAFIGTVLVCTALLGRQPLYQVMAGGLFLGAIFMATDYATSPVGPAAQVVYGVGCGALTVALRYTGLFPEGVTYAILIMNAAAWLLDRYLVPTRYGAGKEGAK